MYLYICDLANLLTGNNCSTLDNLFHEICMMSCL